jgi:hypothetical protein
MKQASTAKYIIQQYIAATGGQAALQGVRSMYAVGKVRMRASEFHLGDQAVNAAQGRAEVGGFVLWQKSPEVWFFELIMAGHKMNAGSDGKVAWRQSAAEQSHVSRGPPRPPRRSLQVRSHLLFMSLLPHHMMRSSASQMHLSIRVHAASRLRALTPARSRTSSPTPCASARRSSAARSASS